MNETRTAHKISVRIPEADLGGILLKWALKKWRVRVCSDNIWFRTGATGGLL
jgi:hypothetical protein